MDRPLWQILLAILVLGFLLQRLAVVAMLVLAGSPAPSLLLGYGLQLASGLATAFAIWLGRGWARVALVALGVAVAATALIEGLFLGLRPPATALSEALVAAVATATLAVVLGHEFGAPGEGLDRGD